jgi:hypothetical protein
MLLSLSHGVRVRLSLAYPNYCDPYAPYVHGLMFFLISPPCVLAIMFHGLIFLPHFMSCMHIMMLIIHFNYFFQIHQ